MAYMTALPMPYHPWLRAGPLLVRADGRRLARGRGDSVARRFPYIHVRGTPSVPGHAYTHTRNPYK